MWQQQTSQLAQPREPEAPETIPFEPFENEAIDPQGPRGDPLETQGADMDPEDEVIEVDDDDAMFDVPGGEAVPMTPDERMGSLEPIFNRGAEDAVQQIK